MRLDGSFSVSVHDQGRFFEQGFDKKSGGTGSEAGEVLMILVIVGRTSRFSYSSFVGMGTRSHDLGAVVWKIVSYCDDLVGEIFRNLVGEIFRDCVGEI